MKIENDFRVGVPIEEAWDLLTDLPAIAPCLPGAQLTGQDGDNYEGKIKIKVGPVTAEYKGSATITEKDEANRRVLLAAKGRDSRGSGNASADITALMTPDGDGTRVEISTDLKVSGKVAQFGRGVMADVSKKLLGNFAECIEHKLATPESDAANVAAAGAEAAGGAVSDAGDAAGAVATKAGDMAGGAADKAADVAGDAAGTAGDAAGKVGDMVGGVGAAGAATAAAGAAAATGAVGAMASKVTGGGDDDNDDDALDLLDVAGGAMAKRLIPLLVVIAIIVIVVLVLAL